jgi:hypothetical protein
MVDDEHVNAAVDAHYADILNAGALLRPEAFAEVVKRLRAKLGALVYVTGQHDNERENEN